MKKVYPERSRRVRVRIAPSPTGFAHVGTAYTALFNFAFAQKSKGKFLIRIEDTDVKRHVPGAEEAIYEGLLWLGLSWDEGPDKGGAFGPYRQSERLALYQDKAKKLLGSKMAYEDEGAIRFKNPGRQQSWDDLVRGKITFPGNEVTDFVMLKSDGYPTYNFAVVVDDIAMEISHVIRAEEHISNTPRQLALYEAFGAQPPLFAHIPALRNEKRQKLSKRRDPVDLRLYKEQGYLPEALVNFLCLLGWSHPKGEEIFGLDEFARLFDLKRVRKAGPIFDLKKLDWLNGEYIRKTQNKKLATQIWEFLGKKYPPDLIEKTIPIVGERIKKLSEYWTMAGFFFEEPKVKSLQSPPAREHLSLAVEALADIELWKYKQLDKNLRDLARQRGWQAGDLFMTLRIAVTGSRIGPPLLESLEILGKEKTIFRVRKALK